MNHFIIFALSAICLVCAEESVSPTHGKVIFCATYSYYPAESKFQNENVDWNLCTHVNVRDEGFMPMKDSWDLSDKTVQERNIQDLKHLLDLRQRFKHLKLIWNVCKNFVDFLDIATNREMIKSYIQKAYKFISEISYDGMNIIFNDLEWNAADDFKKFILFIGDLKAQFENLLLIITMGVTKNFDPDNYDFSSLSDNIDYLSIERYYHIQSGKDYTVADALADRSLSHIKWNIETIIENKFPVEKLVLHLCFRAPVMQKAGKNRNYIHAFDQICGQWEDNTIWKRFEGDAGSVILQNQNSDLCIVFETTRRIANEVFYIMQRGLAGVMTGDVDYDDYEASCKIDDDTFDDYVSKNGFKLHISFEKKPKFTLLSTINIAINALLNETLHKSAASQSKPHNPIQIGSSPSPIQTGSSQSTTETLTTNSNTSATLSAIPNSKNSTGGNTSAASNGTFIDNRFIVAMLVSLVFLMFCSMF